MNGGSAPHLPVAVVVLFFFVVGMIASFWLGGMFGATPPLFWASIVVFFLIGVLFLEKPKIFLVCMFIYYGFVPSAILFGKFPVPIPMSQLLDELILIVPLALLTMKAVQRSNPKGGGRFIMLYIFLSGLSWYVNKAPTLNAFRVALTYSKFFIFWYFVRAIGPWSAKERKVWFLVVVGFGLLQFLFNVYWQSNIVVTIHPDFSTGTFGGAHGVGYMSCFALFLLAGWFMTASKPMRLVKVVAALAVTGAIAYDLIFMTDTKHVLFLVGPAAIPFVLHPGFKKSLRMTLVGGAVGFFLLSWFYVYVISGEGFFRVQQFVDAFNSSGKAEIIRALRGGGLREVPVPVLGAGPGNFCSSVALFAMRPLSNKYVLPYIITAMKSRGASTESSVIGNPQTALFTLWGEFGIVTAVLYYGFLFVIIGRLWRRSRQVPVARFEEGQEVALVSCLLLLLELSVILEIFTFQPILFPVWILVGMYWDFDKKAAGEKEQPEPAPEPKRWIPKRIAP